MALEGSDKDQLAVIGEDVDSAKLTCLLGKKLCYASILSVKEMKPEENEVEELDDKNQESLNCTIAPSYPPFPRFCEVEPMIRVQVPASSCDQHFIDY